MTSVTTKSVDDGHFDLDDFDFLFKIILVGNQGVGKTSVVTRFVKNTYTEESKPTIGVEFATRTILIDNVRVRIQIWDTAGQERFRGLTHTYYRGAVGALVVYDIQSKQSFDACERWHSELQQHCDNKDLTVILVGNKADQKHLREVSKDEAERFSVQHDMLWLETSAAAGTSVEEAFTEVVRNALRKRKAETVMTGGETMIGKTIDAHGRKREDVIRLEKFEPIKVTSGNVAEKDGNSNASSCSC